MIYSFVLKKSLLKVGDLVAYNFDFSYLKNGAPAVTLSSFGIAFNKGAERIYKFSILVSTDGVNYTEVLKDATSSGTTANYETYKITTPMNAKYVKYVGKGSNTNAWNNIFEIVFCK